MDRAKGGPGHGLGRLRERPGNPEVGHLHAAVAGDQDVARLDIAVDEAPFVRGGDRARCLGCDPRRLTRRQRAGPPDDRGQVFAVDELHDDVRADLVGAVVVHGHHAGMVQRRRRLRLLPKAGEEVRVVAVLGPQDLDRHVAFELAVAGSVDGRHPALAEELDQAVTPAEDSAEIGQGQLPVSIVRRWARSSGPVSGRWRATSIVARSQPIVVPASYRTPSNS